MNNMVLDALWPGHPDMITLNHDLGLHVLDIYHKSFCGYGHQEGRRGSEEQHDMPSAVELHEAGVHFKAVHNANLGDIRFERGVLSVPVIWFYDSIECEFLNLMAFERLHPKARNYVMEYVFFMDNLVDSAADVALLCSNGVIVNLLGSNEEVATLFNKILSKEAVMSLSSKLHDVHGQVSAHCRKPWNKWRANLIHTYFSNPWVFISLLAATILLVATLIQTIYTVVPFKRKDP
uniref:Uncharacterized protein n=1 Tax=Arundo donax TaxID=35708 RepID=A0A0A9ARY5_ARUDO